MTLQFIIIIILIALGYILKRLNYFKANDSQVFATLVLNVTLPSLVIVNLNHANLDFSLSILPIMMIVYGVVAKVIVVWLFRKHNRHIRGSLGMMTAALNIGVFAYPLVEAIWPNTGLIYFGMADIGGAIVMFGISYFVGSHFSNHGQPFSFKFLGKSLLKSVPLVTYIVMFTLNICNLHLPHPIIQFFDVLSKANLPLSMILLGLMLNFNIEKHFLPLALKYILCHYSIGAVAGLLIHFFLPVNDPMIKSTLQVAWLLPVGVAIVPYAIQFRYKTLPLIGMATNSTILISIVILYIYQAVVVN
ncbi:AEC family transporter [Staphylococcus sp. SQ8-PEA]|uniref:AEC family transporter n=1 Tax=Staphylococcus marylandisciuri TaxID=2981529 RepID=A0ABT2QMH7_9STAP|nr:AEC family transporter [Staphylococcus marylandisciuri]MCU5745167.1 AEC family transporter [Staphylococcus marylandisciuri]